MFLTNFTTYYLAANTLVQNIAESVVEQNRSDYYTDSLKQLMKTVDFVARQIKTMLYLAGLLYVLTTLRADTQADINFIAG